jgi:curved DNA-binding protein
LAPASSTKPTIRSGPCRPPSFSPPKNRQPSPGGAGDLYIVTGVRPHPYFRREGNDIYVEVPISFRESALGGKVDVPTLDGMTTVTIPPGTASGRRLRLRGKGVKAGEEVGDQYAVIRIVPPTTVSESAAKLLKEFDAKEPFDPRANAPWRTTP